MAHDDPINLLPAFLDPLLDRLADSLPPIFYDTVVGLLSHSVAAITAIARIAASFLNRNPSELTAEVLIPPIITILAAYLALSSLYRTASWAIRLTFFFVKWGTIIGILMASAGYIAANGGGAVRNQYAGQALGLFSSLLGSGATPRGNQQTKARAAPRQSKAKTHSQKEWQYQEEGDKKSGNIEAQQIMDSIVAAASKALEGDWWGVMSSLGQGNQEADGKSQKERAGKARVGKSRSR